MWILGIIINLSTIDIRYILGKYMYMQQVRLLLLYQCEYYELLYDLYIKFIRNGEKNCFITQSNGTYVNKYFYLRVVIKYTLI